MVILYENNAHTVILKYYINTLAYSLEVYLQFRNSSYF